MSETAEFAARRTNQGNFWRQIWLLVGFLAMYVPTYWDVAHRFWGNEEESHGPIILAIIVWLLWRERNCLFGSPSSGETTLGLAALFIGLFLYAVGRSQEFFQFDVGSQAFVIVGLSFLLGGSGAVKRYWFPAFFTLFVIPIPPSLLDEILVPLKVVVSDVVTDGLFSVGLPISHSGVVLVIGQYELLIADACSGLRSMIALTGIGFLYCFLMRRPERTTSLILLLSSIPIAFLANILRVTTLVLVTYWFGSAAGTSFHDIAGYFEILLAFGSFFFLDSILRRLAGSMKFLNNSL